MLDYKPKRDSSENIIRVLCESYPKTFFDNPRLRKPLKKNIIDDILNDKNLDIDPKLIGAAVDWYKTHLGYYYSEANAGVKRVDLTGKEVNAVTELEAKAAQKKIAEVNQQRNDLRAGGPVEVLTQMYQNGEITDCGVKKVDAPKITKAAQVAPEFVPIYETLTLANTTVSSIAEPAMRLAVARAALDEVLKKVAAVKEALTMEG